MEKEEAYPQTIRMHETSMILRVFYIEKGRLGKMDLIWSGALIGLIMAVLLIAWDAFITPNVAKKGA